MILSDVSNDRNNNLNIIRFIAATLVIYSHSFPLCKGENCIDQLARITEEQIDFGNLAVCLFFFFAGFLISKSLGHTKSAARFWVARISRIMPPLVTVTFVLTFIVGPIITNKPVLEYFGDANAYKYLLNAVFVLKHNLPGVFTNNIYGPTVNGPLWTLPVEVLCYILCFSVYSLGFLNKKHMKWMIPTFVCGCIVFSYVFSGNELILSVIRPVGMFFSGMVAYVFRDDIKLYGRWAVICLFGLIISSKANILSISVFGFLAYLCLYLAYGTKKKYSSFGTKAEISYGMYLCGWPIQQILVMISNNHINVYVNAVLASVFAIIMGYIIAIVVEKPVANMVRKLKVFSI